jgi:hypothetical protein
MVTIVKLNQKIESLKSGFQDGNHREELKRLLGSIGEAIRNGREGRFHIYDINGNCVGAAFLDVWSDTEEEETEE